MQFWEGRRSTAGWPLGEGVEREAHGWKGKSFLETN